MSIYTRATIEARFNRAPEIIREAMYSEETALAIRKIGDRHGLHIDQMGVLADEVGLVMLGLEKSSDFVKNVTERLGIGPSEAEQIATEVNNEIFLPIRESLKQLDERQNTPTPEELLREIENTTAPKVEERVSILERKLREPMSSGAVENVIEGEPDTPTTSDISAPRIDPYLERPE